MSRTESPTPVEEASAHAACRDDATDDSYNDSEHDASNKSLLDNSGAAGNSGLTLDIALHQSWFRTISYSMLLIVILVGQVITTRYNIKEKQGGGWTEGSQWPAIDLESNPIYDVFGYNNICLYFDELPAKYIALWLSELFVIAHSIYVSLSGVSVYLAHKQGKYSKLQFRFIAVTIFLDLLAITYFIEVFAVSPKDDFFMHTMPFSFLIVSVATSGLRNVYIDWKEVDYASSTLPHAKLLEGLYAVLLVVSSAYKIYVQYQGIVKGNPPNPKLGQASDLVWMLVAVALPWVKTLGGICMPKWLPRKDQMLRVSIGNSNLRFTDLDACFCCGRPTAAEKNC